MCAMLCRKGLPTLMTMAERMYWKHETRKSVVLSELMTFECSGSSTGA